jgi:8-oxo-dGTP pyrophosphatase MutT (NUDIX family)
MSDSDTHLLWKELSRRQIASCGIFNLFTSERRSGDGRNGEFWILEARDWVNVVPLVAAAGGEPGLLMVRQYRHGAEKITTEFPAGLVEPGEDPAVAAARELREETGHRAGRLTLIGSVHPNPAFMTNRCFTFLAEDLEAVSAQDLDDTESLDFMVLPVTDVQAQAGRGELVNALTLVALMSFQRFQRERPRQK